MLAVAQNGDQGDDRDRGPSGLRSARERSCALTRAVRPLEELIRFVIGPDGAPVPDLKQKLPGRGLWITATRAALDEAVKRNVFARGFKRELRIPAGFAGATEALLERAALDALAMIGKGAHIVCGHAKVEAALERDDPVALVHASDAAEDGKRKIANAARRRAAGEKHEIPVIEAFSGAQLDLALNRLNVVHAALLAGPVSDTFLARTERLQRFRAGFADAATNTMAPAASATETEIGTEAE